MCTAYLQAEVIKLCVLQEPLRWKVDVLLSLPITLNNHISGLKRTNGNDGNGISDENVFKRTRTDIQIKLRIKHNEGKPHNDSKTLSALGMNMLMKFLALPWDCYSKAYISAL